jgi:hypothetical protein
MVIFHGTWSVIVNGDRFGPYGGEKEAMLIAKAWAERARKRGRSIGVLIDCDRTISRTIH